jgi:hypothetical protein
MTQIDRRAFIGAAGMCAMSAQAAASPLPTVPLGNVRISRLIVGSNQIQGFSHATPQLDAIMSQYFTVERTTEFLLNCERLGINTFQGSYSPKVRDALQAARDRGSKMHYICLASNRQDDVFKEILAMKPLAIVHHGGVTDSLFYSGKHEAVRDYVKRIKDLGLLAGVSTHNPEHLARVDDYGWEADLYMACLYNVTRRRDHLDKMLGDHPVDELFLTNDPKLMTARIRKVGKTCLAFKILAAGRVCQSRESVEKAFSFAYSNIKPTDSVIVGMFPVLADELQQNVEFARRFAGQS